MKNGGGLEQLEEKARNQAREDFLERVSKQHQIIQKRMTKCPKMATRKILKNLMSPFNKTVKAEAKLQYFED